ncbi:hypothetical protein P43SY_002097 [Pythium insidiosum]|uniref:Eukaryotic initiation factor 4E n=1 Tax=Pythium insidiosum TaxID=114742 RepID=A0AAD5QCB2_PYTIN|nr:hypothetical protein P43SY_002097 [Pythium insidiosum]
MGEEKRSSWKETVDSKPSGETPIQNAYSFSYIKRNSGKAEVSVQESYEKSIKDLGDFKTVQGFWRVYNHLVRPNDLPNTMDYHLFKTGIKPMWEDPANRKGGKWMVRVRKGIASRYWEDLVLAIIGEQFDVGNEICGAVVSIRYTEDVISLWNRNADNNEACYRIRDTMRKVLNLPQFVALEYRRHDQSLNDQSGQQRNQGVGNNNNSNSNTNANAGAGGNTHSNNSGHRDSTGGSRDSGTSSAWRSGGDRSSSSNNQRDGSSSTNERGGNSRFSRGNSDRGDRGDRSDRTDRDSRASGSSATRNAWSRDSKRPAFSRENSTNTDGNTGRSDSCAEEQRRFREQDPQLQHMLHEHYEYILQQVDPLMNKALEQVLLYQPDQTADFFAQHFRGTLNVKNYHYMDLPRQQYFDRKLRHLLALAINSAVKERPTDLVAFFADFFEARTKFYG